jgi:hypothetical protein
MVGYSEMLLVRRTHPTLYALIGIEIERLCNHEYSTRMPNLSMAFGIIYLNTVLALPGAARVRNPIAITSTRTSTKNQR